MCLAVMLVDEAAFVTEAELDDAFITDDDLLQAQKLSLIERSRSCSPMTLPERWMVSGKETPFGGLDERSAIGYRCGVCEPI
ncbi:hypothetical protein ABIA06_003224 [Bradyrhizobium yuanmingense]|uniref:hypothetical protein n=1 Tax=Bradyrhizobium yuanmingense TaxID=108015 RepID=UPI0035121B38